MTDFDPQAIVSTLISHGEALGLYDSVNGHEPASPPGSGLTAAVWADYLGPAPGSGLKVTQGLFVVKWRGYTSMLAEPPDAIDPALLRATWSLMAAISADIDLGIRDAAGDPAAWVDLLGMSRTRLESLAGYIQHQDRTFRVMTTTVPIIIDDLWTQSQ